MDRIKILIIDDNEDSLLTLSEFLQTQGFKCLLASNGLKALSFINDDFDYAIVDIDLPDINGLKLSKIIKEKKPNAYIILNSANSIWEGKMLADDNCADIFIPKPIDLNLLMKTINQNFALSKEK